MRMDGQDESTNVEDVRGMRGGGGGGFGIGGRGIGLGTRRRRGDRRLDLRHQPADAARHDGRRRAATAQIAQPQGPAPAPPADDAQARVRLAGAAQHRGRLDRRLPAGRADLPAAASSCCSATAGRPACGQGQAAMGPFYCPNDQKVYIDLRFYNVLEQQARRAGRVRAGLRGRARGRPPRAEPARHHGQGRRAARRAAARRRPTRSACASSCRPTASPASGRSARSRSRAGGSSRATSRRR